MTNIKIARQKSGLSQKYVALTLGVSAHTVSEWESGKKNPTTENLNALAALFGVSIDFLLGVTPESPERTADTSDGIWIPILGDVAAGIPIEAITDIVGYEEIPKAMADTGEFFGLRIKVNSMEPRICEGDVVIVRKQDDADTGDIAVVLVNGDSATVKKIKKRPEGLMMILIQP